MTQSATRVERVTGFEVHKVLDHSSVQSFIVCGVPIAAATPEDAANLLVNAAANGQRCEAHLCNAYTLSLVESDEKLKDALSRAQLNLADGTPVAWLGRHLGMRAPVRGPGLVAAVAKHGVAADVRHFFYGGVEGVAEEVDRRLRRAVPGVRIVGMETPPFRELSSDEVDALAARIRLAGANLVWIGLGTPRQDYLVPRLADRLAMPIVPVGAAFDFLAGRVQEAPKWMQGTGLEWTYRFIKEPRRLWRRYVIGNPRFVVTVIRERVARSG